MKQDIETLKDEIMKMPEEMRDSVCWVIKHMNIVDYMIRGDSLSQSEIEELARKALEKKEYTLLAVLLYKEAYDKLLSGEELSCSIITDTFQDS